MIVLVCLTNIIDWCINQLVRSILSFVEILLIDRFPCPIDCCTRTFGCNDNLQSHFKVQHLEQNNLSPKLMSWQQCAKGNVNGHVTLVTHRTNTKGTSWCWPCCYAHFSTRFPKPPSPLFFSLDSNWLLYDLFSLSFMPNSTPTFLLSFTPPPLPFSNPVSHRLSYHLSLPKMKINQKWKISPHFLFPCKSEK